jgi:hypothetical protein
MWASERVWWLLPWPELPWLLRGDPPFWPVLCHWLPVVSLADWPNEAIPT